MIPSENPDGSVTVLVRARDSRDDRLAVLWPGDDGYYAAVYRSREFRALCGPPDPPEADEPPA